MHLRRAPAWLPTLLAPALALASGVAAWLVSPSAAHACATCSCGDPTITSMGTEQSFAGRLRLSLGFSHRGEHSGEAFVDEERLDEDRLDLNVAYSPTAWLQLAATLPLLQREVTEVDLSSDTLRGTGDLELRARLTLWRDRHFAPRHLVGLTVGAALPTAEVQRDEMGDPMDLDHQLGGVAVTPRLGVFYAHFRHPWSVYASASAAHVILVRGEERPGDSLIATSALQYQPGETWGVRVAIDGKLEDHATHGGMHGMPDTGGFALFVSPGLIYSPVTDLVFEASIQLPVVNGLYGDHVESPAVLLGSSYDF
jgi:hypothetical protein